MVEASWFIDKILFRSKYMKTFTRSSIELVSPSVSSGTSCPTTQCFLFFRSGFHMSGSIIYNLTAKTLLKYIQTILGTYFTVSPIDLIPTVYKLSKNNRSFDRYVYYIINKIKNKRIAYVSTPFWMGNYIGNVS